MSKPIKLRRTAIKHLTNEMRTELHRRRFTVGGVRVLQTRYDCDRKAMVVVYAVTYHDRQVCYRGTAIWQLDERFRPVRAGPDLHLEDARDWISPELEWVEEALKRSPKDVDLLQERGYRLFQLGRFEEAYGALSAACSNAREYAPALYWLGQTELELGMFELAELHFRRALEGDRHNANTLRGLAESLLRRRQLKRALAAIGKALVVDSEDASALALRAEIGEALTVEAEAKRRKATKRREAAKRAEVTKREATKRRKAPRTVDPNQRQLLLFGEHTRQA